jgi:alkylated DNA repair dioxygenase AlkB
MNDLFDEASLSPHPGAERSAADKIGRSAPFLAFTLDHALWLRFLADDWLPLSDKNFFRVGVGAPFGVKLPADRIEVTVWIDANQLPAIDIFSYRNNKWKKMPLRKVTNLDQEIAWPGPIPLFSVVEFSVRSDDALTRLIAMAKGFGNVGLPEQPITIQSPIVNAAKNEPPAHLTPLRPPQFWNALRGAATMAVWAVPAIDPWLDLLCESLSISSETTVTPPTEAIWWAEAPWRNVAPGTRHTALWRAALDVFSNVTIRQGWGPIALLNSICDGARKLDGETTQLDEFQSDTRAILNDQKTVDVRRAKSDPLGLALQLILLRPRPEQFITWKDDLPSMPPVVWWTGATLSGFITGYRDLTLRFRGQTECRRLLALRTWHLSEGATSQPITWPDEPADKIDWDILGGKIRLKAANQVWAERRENSRGKWYRADFCDENVLAAAMKLAKQFQPSAVIRCLSVTDENLQFFGNGTISIDQSKSCLSIQGNLNFTVNSNAEFADQLDCTRFRNWLANGSIPERLPDPPDETSIAQETTSLLLPINGSPSVVAFEDIPGLLMVSDFLLEEEEAKLIKLVDEAPWLPALSRRVQHYGWKYDYKARRINSNSYLGPLPEWAMDLGQRLLENGFLKENPDQVIVNEYIENQGIGKHVDCLDCFRGAIVTISLCETWQMTFRGPDGQKIEKTLPRKSAVILDGPARETWTHEIPKRKKEPSGVRGRRVSLTFRKVSI